MNKTKKPKMNKRNVQNETLLVVWLLVLVLVLVVELI